MKLEVLISTLNDGITNIDNVLSEKTKYTHYLISHQIWGFQEDREQRDRLQCRDDVRVVIAQEKGLSKSRNFAIEHSIGDICLIADDDIKLVDDAETKILDAFKCNPDADIITFKIKPSPHRRSKKYALHPFWYNFKRLANVSSIEIVIKTSSIKDVQLSFDESFGLGAKYPIGEEFIFLSDAYRKGLKILYWPEVIVSHPHASSGEKLDDETIFARGAMFARVFGWKAFIVNCLFSIKKHSEYSKEISFSSYLMLLTKGSMDFFNSHEKRVS